jgi:hypothetical protein
MLKRGREIVSGKKLARAASLTAAVAALRLPLLGTAEIGRARANELGQ